MYSASAEESNRGLERHEIATKEEDIARRGTAGLETASPVGVAEAEEFWSTRRTDEATAGSSDVRAKR
jgi:hypothetical protein